MSSKKQKQQAGDHQQGTGDEYERTATPSMGGQDDMDDKKEKRLSEKLTIVTAAKSVRAQPRQSTRAQRALLQIPPNHSIQYLACHLAWSLRICGHFEDGCGATSPFSSTTTKVWPGLFMAEAAWLFDVQIRRLKG